MARIKETQIKSIKSSDVKNSDYIRVSFKNNPKLELFVECEGVFGNPHMTFYVKDMVNGTIIDDSHAGVGDVVDGINNLLSTGSGVTVIKGKVIADNELKAKRTVARKPTRRVRK